MKQLLTSFVLALLISMVCIKATAHDIEVVNSDGVTIYYIWTWSNGNKELSVSYQGNYCHSYMNEYSGTIIIPESITYNGTDYSVTGIDNMAFYNCPGLKSLTIPNSVTSIGKEAFHSCSGLTSLAIPNSVTSIGYDAFYGCSSLTKIPIRVKDYSAFCNNQVVGAIASVTEIPIQLIDYEGNEITEYIIPEGTTSIGDYAFSGCSGLTSVTIPASVTSIGYDVFKNCSGLTNIYIRVKDYSAFCNNQV